MAGWQELFSRVISELGISITWIILSAVLSYFSRMLLIPKGDAMSQAQSWTITVIVFIALLLPLVFYEAGVIINEKNDSIKELQTKYSKSIETESQLQGQCQMLQTKLSMLAADSSSKTQSPTGTGVLGRWKVDIHDPSEIHAAHEGVDIEIAPRNETWNKPYVLLPISEIAPYTLQAGFGDIGGNPEYYGVESEYEQISGGWGKFTCEATITPYKALYIMGSNKPTKFGLLLRENNERIEFAWDDKAKTYFPVSH